MKTKIIKKMLAGSLLGGALLAPTIISTSCSGVWFEYHTIKAGPLTKGMTTEADGIKMSVSFKNKDGVDYSKVRISNDCAIIDVGSQGLNSGNITYKVYNYHTNGDNQFPTFVIWFDATKTPAVETHNYRFTFGIYNGDTGPYLESWEFSVNVTA